jgi:imidazolonepropionase-like amidohydrolase
MMLTPRSAFTAVLVTLLCACGARSPGTAPAHDSFLVRGARVFDGERVLEHADVLVAGATIEAVAPSLVAPPGAAVIDGTGKTLLPGLIDSHFHAASRSMLRQAPLFGVTTVADMNNNPVRFEFLRARTGTPEMAREADFFGAGRLITADAGYAINVGGEGVASPDACAAAVASRLAHGADYIKIAVEDGTMIFKEQVKALDAETIAACVAAAHKAGKKIVAHVTNRRLARVTLDAGIDGFVHGIGDGLDDRLVADIAARHIFVVPTLVIFRSATPETLDRSVAQDPAFAPFLDSMTRENLSAAWPSPVFGMAKDVTKIDLAALDDGVRRLAAAGVPLLVGTDSPAWGTAAGVSVHEELALLVRAGLTPAQALAGATSSAANAFGWHDRGRIAPGMRADLVLVEGDPTRDITTTRRIAHVWKRGHEIERTAAKQRVPVLDRGWAAYLGKRYPEAEQAFAAALALDPSDGDIAYGLASMESLDGHLDQALAHLRQAVAYDPSYRDWSAQDPDLENLRKRPEFAAVVTP